jgi:hypothetical protein
MTALPTLLVLLALALPPVAVSGRVRTFDDGPVPGATVIVRQGDRVLTAMTNERGEFDIPEATLPASDSEPCASKSRRHRPRLRLPRRQFVNLFSSPPVPQRIHGGIPPPARPS